MITLSRVGFAVLVAVGVCLGANGPCRDQDHGNDRQIEKEKIPVQRRQACAEDGGQREKNSSKNSYAKTAVKKAATTTVVGRRRVAAPRAPRVSASTRMEANQGVFQKVSTGARFLWKTPGTLIPFFEQLYRHQKGDMPGPLRILHYGDSHTAADEWTGDLRSRFQEKFGDGGSGYSLVGPPLRGLSAIRRAQRVHSRVAHRRSGRQDAGRRRFTGSAASACRRGRRANPFICWRIGQQFELFYLQQPGGGAIQIYDNGSPVERISTDGTPAPGYYHYEGVPGQHKFEVETLEQAPVRLFGWVAENSRGVTYEELGINGAQASIRFELG